MIAAVSTHLVIADDHPLFRDALRQAVATVVALAKIDEAGSFDELTSLLEQDSDVDLILLDLTMPGISGFSGLIYLRAQYPAIPVVIVSASDDAGTHAPPLARCSRLRLHSKTLRVRDAAGRDHESDGRRRLGSPGYRSVSGQR